MKSINSLKRFNAFPVISLIILASIQSLLFTYEANANEYPSNTTQASLPRPLEAPSQIHALPKDSRVPGGIAVIPLGKDFKNAKVTVDGKPIWVLKGKQQGWAIIGIPLSQPAGPLTYSINGQSDTVDVHAKSYKEQHLTVKKKHSNPPSRDMDRIRKESRLSQNAFRLFSNINEGAPYAQFEMPAQGPISSPFGLKRFFNEQPRRPHSGLDIAAPRGADIVAPMDGKIVLTGNFFFNGNSIFIDHGQGLVTMYCHMDSLESKEGQWVSAGDLIGTIGATGRVTGPHLHWTVSLNNTRVDPMLFLKNP